MKKRLKLLLAAVLIAGMPFLTGCGKYVSSYSAVGFVHSNTSGSASMSFYQFSGRMVFTLKNRDGSEGQLKVSAALESGSAAVYCDEDGTKKELFSLQAGDALESVFGPLTCKTVYIIVETSEKCRNGSLRFDMEKQAAE